MLRLTTAFVRGYAKKVAAAVPTMQSQKVKHDVITDPVKLATYCCGSNIYQTGEDVKLGADEDYPQWLWEMHVGKPLELHELSKDTEEYWKRVALLGNFQKNRRLRKQVKPEIRINEKHKLKITESLIHRALAFKDYDPGTELDQYKKEKRRKFGPLA